jgi:hypothetical protein
MMARGTEMAAEDQRRDSHWIVVPETETAITLETIPGAVCELRHENDTGNLLRLHADDQGRVRFHACPSGAASTIETRRVAISSDPAGMTESESRSEAHSWPVVPALGEGLLTLTNAELVARGYPPRPHPTRSPSHFAQWRRLVSRPWARVGDRRVSRSDVAFGPQPAAASPTLPLPPPRADLFNGSLDNWSGAVYTESGPLKNQVEFFYITGTWNVPIVFAGLPGSPAYSAAAEWVGLNAGKLFQSGSDSEAWNIPFPEIGSNWVFTNYWSWIEAYPDPPWGISNVPVSPGDEMQVIIFVADATGNTSFVDGDGGGLTPADNKVWFMVYNFTKGTSYWGTLDAVGWFSSANFIVERPEENGATAPLAIFAVASMTRGSYATSRTGYQEMYPLGSAFDSVSYINMQSKASGDVLDTVTPIPAPGGTGDNLYFFWHAYD